MNKVVVYSARGYDSLSTGTSKRELKIDLRSSPKVHSEHSEDNKKMSVEHIVGEGYDAPSELAPPADKQIAITPEKSAGSAEPQSAAKHQRIDQ